MTNLTPSEARRLIDKLRHNQTKEHGISILEEKYLAALEIALPVLEQKGGWISIHDRKPEDVGKYLTFGSHGVGTSWYHRPVHRWLFQDCDTKCDEGMGDWDNKVFYVTHWKPLDAPPQSKPSTTPQIDNDGWIDWKGGECPVLPVQVVDIKFRAGGVMTGEAGGWSWNNDQKLYDIIAYRVIENDGRGRDKI